MKTKRGKRSEAFWPSLVMKKWLNIQPKAYDFSEDEDDTETESEDDAYSLKDASMQVHEDHGNRTQGTRSVCTSKVSDVPAKSHQTRHWRRKSETLRVQYINTKDLRVTIGTWNVGGRLPHEDLEIDNWLCTEEPADMYIIGFQEVVPLNAGNVLGAEDSRPIPEWEAIIRRTLNQTLEPEGKHKSFSAPPSPVPRTSSVSDILADAVNDHQLEMMNQDYVQNANCDNMEQNGTNKESGIGRSSRLNRFYSLEWDSRLDWPEYSLDATPQVPSKLQRSVSSNSKMGSNFCLENPLILSPYLALNGCGLKRFHHSSGDLRSMCIQSQETAEVLDAVSDSSDGFSEEEDDAFLEISMSMEKQRDVVTKDNVKSRPKYVRIVSKQMIGIYVSVWVRRRLRRHVNNLKVSTVGVGLMGYMGNKGSVSVSMSVFQSRLCFVCSHLTSGHKDGSEQRRNADVSEIMRRTCFSPVFDTDQPLAIPSHDQVFWYGDLNYRLNMLDAEVRKLVALKLWNELMNYDQLTRALHIGRVFEGWKEGPIDFPPTYKYEINSDRFVGENPKGEKRRSPAWCDRILWLGRGIRQLSYKCAEIRLSDHRPVSSIFSVEVEVLDQRKLQRALNYKSAAVHPEIFFGENEAVEL